jgi:hypothetical protein
VKNSKVRILSIALLGAFCESTFAFTFDSGNIKGSFDSTLSIGTGIRSSAPGCDTVIGTNTPSGVPGLGQPTGAGAPTGCLDAFSGYVDQGNLNYKKGDAFTTYVKGTHELLLEFPDAYKFMGRVNWLRDFTATHASGYISGANSTGGEAYPEAARNDLAFKARLLDFWVSKEFDVDGQRARLRVGNQVVSWGESAFIGGGINQTNAIDIMRLSQPGTQLKEALLPAPIVSLASGLGNGFNVEAYTQMRWNENYMPPAGSYWSLAQVGKGYADAPKPKNGGQYGVALRYQPREAQANFGLYAMRYHDKSASLYALDPNPTAPVFASKYLEDRTLYGISANFPVGNWAIGSELSYRPKDAVTLNTNGANNIDSGLCLVGGKCYVEEKKYQFHLTGTLMLTPGDQGPLLNLFGADSGMFIGEAAAVHYPNLQKTYQGVPVSAGQWGWGALTANDPFVAAIATQNFPPPDLPSVGDRTSWGYAFDFSVTYDGTLIPGWQVSPEVFYSRGVKGRTPNQAGTFMEGASAANYVLTFTQNPPNWSVAINYSKFYGGTNIYDQPYRNRDFYGVTVNRNF